MGRRASRAAAAPDPILNESERRAERERAALARREEADRLASEQRRANAAEHQGRGRRRRASRPASQPDPRPIATREPRPSAEPTGDLPPRTIVLVGPMAAGKTSIGRRVARELGIPFVDSDARIVQAHGPIADIFEKRGEPAFRVIEADTIAAELAEPGARVLALGGGAVLSEATRERLRAHPVILLMTTERAVKRTANLTKRPLLRDDPGAWSRILAERLPVYEAVADVTFRTDRATKEQLVRRMADWILHPEQRGQENEGAGE